MSSAHLEVERKYEAPEVGISADLSAVKGLNADPAVQDQQLEATYFDTAQRDLMQRRMVVRRRRGGHDEGWHLKFTDGGNRHEVHFPLLADGTSMPAAVVRTLQGVTRGRQLSPIAHLATHRRRTMLQDHQGRHVAELCDDTVSAVDYATGITRQWREWEVELVDGAMPAERQEEIFSAVEKALIQAGAKLSTSGAKIARALGHDADFDRAAGIEPAPSEPTPSESASAEAPGPDSRGEQHPSGQEGLPVLDESQRVISDLLSAVAVRLPVADVAARVGVEWGFTRLAEGFAGYLGAIRSMEGILKDRSFAAQEQAALLVIEALEPVRRMEEVLHGLPDLSLWDEQTERAREELRRLGEEDLRSERASAQSWLSGSEYLEALETVCTFAQRPAIKRRQEGGLPKRFASNLLERAGKELKQQRKLSEDLREQAEGSGAEEDAQAALRAWTVARGMAESAAGLADAVEEGLRLGGQKAKLVTKLRKEGRKVHRKERGVVVAEAMLVWLERAARVFQRRDIDRLAVGMLIGELRASRG